jgi:chemotaxis protein CheX
MMKVEYLNPVVQGAQGILTQLCGEKARMGKLSVKKGFSEEPDIGVYIGLIGELKGYALFIMSHDTGHFLASKLMQGLPDAMIEEMLPSAVAEITNMVSGRVSALYCDIGIKSDITPPTFASPTTGDFFAFVPTGVQLISIPLTFENGSALEVVVFFL